MHKSQRRSAGRQRASPGSQRCGKISRHVPPGAGREREAVGRAVVGGGACWKSVLPRLSGGSRPRARGRS